MILPEIAKVRLYAQQIATSRFKTAAEIVGWMGAMQAQDYAMSKWAVGLRLPGSSEQMINDAIDRGEIIRTHLLRPTWHLVAAKDIYWMLELTAPRIKATLKWRHHELGLTEDIFRKSHTLLGNVLRDGKHLSHEALRPEFMKAGISIDENRLYHLLMRAETDLLICSGKSENSRPTYALLEERVPRYRTIIREEALAVLARRYFNSHGPATLQDFTWWSGLTAGDSKLALEMAKQDLISEKIGDTTYFLTDPVPIPLNENDQLHLLPAFDEFTISYLNRTTSISIDKHKKIVSSNGFFRPLIVRQGQVIGIWKRSAKKDHVSIETMLFGPPGREVADKLDKAAATLSHFLNKKIILIDPSKTLNSHE